MVVTCKVVTSKVVTSKVVTSKVVTSKKMSSKVVTSKAVTLKVVTSKGSLRVSSNFYLVHRFSSIRKDEFSYIHDLSYFTIF